MNIQDVEMLLSKVTPGSWKIDGTSLEAEFEDGTRISIAEIKQMYGWSAVWEPGANGELFAKARGTLAVASMLAEAHEAEEAVDQHFARCSYEQSGAGSCETASEDDGQAFFCKDHKRLAEIAAAKRNVALIEWETL